MSSDASSLIMEGEGLIAIRGYISLLESEPAFKICFPPLIYKYFNQ